MGERAGGGWGGYIRTVDRKVNQPVANALADLLDDSSDADFVDLVCLDEREAYDGVVFIVAGAGEGRADTGVLKVGSVSIKGGFVGERGGGGANGFWCCFLRGLLCRRATRFVWLV